MTQQPNKIIGTVTELWRFPVKSLRGECCPCVQVDSRGVAYDRLYAAVNAAGKLGSHKSTRRFERMEGLYRMQARVRDATVEVKFPDGNWLPVSDQNADSMLSATLAQPVRFQSEAEVAHQDMGAVHILTTASMRWLQARMPDSRIDPRRFRANILIDCPGTRPVEQDWVGHHLQIGDVRLMIVEPAERCVMTTIAVDELPADPAILRTLVQQADAQFGVYARVVNTGEIQTGSPVTATSLSNHSDMAGHSSRAG